MLVLAELAQGPVPVALVWVALASVAQEQVALEWEPVSCRGRKTSIQKSASLSPIL